MMHMLFGMGCFILGVLLGYVAPWPQRFDGPDIFKENLKLRKENELLWKRLQDEGKIDRF